MKKLDEFQEGKQGRPIRTRSTVDLERGSSPTTITNHTRSTFDPPARYGVNAYGRTRYGRSEVAIYDYNVYGDSIYE